MFLHPTAIHTHEIETSPIMTRPVASIASWRQAVGRLKNSTPEINHIAHIPRTVRPICILDSLE